MSTSTEAVDDDDAVNVGKGSAYTWAGVAISQSISNANNSIAKQSTSAVPLETIFARFLFVFIYTLYFQNPASFP